MEARFLDNLGEEELKKFRNAPIVVGLKAVRDILNAKLICYHASIHNEEVGLYHSTDSISRTKVPLGIRNCLWNVSSTVNKDALGRLPLFCSMKVMVTENIALASGVANGSEGVVNLYTTTKMDLAFKSQGLHMCISLAVALTCLD